MQARGESDRLPARVQTLTPRTPPCPKHGFSFCINTVIQRRPCHVGAAQVRPCPCRRAALILPCPYAFSPAHPGKGMPLVSVKWQLQPCAYNIKWTRLAISPRQATALLRIRFCLSPLSTTAIHQYCCDAVSKPKRIRGLHLCKYDKCS